ncbi:Protein of unknown function [Pyronema omphalodes CBS 100304]|uniref:Uncharacterized protein n=1 Tax=Pyronema omphalodes (strain CBS 100304) TaxID=1076935 RepID=U4L2R7_PYROM|nr:Protein of unknown function [Pyronema omphalodes CBS 100304]
MRASNHICPVESKDQLRNPQPIPLRQTLLTNTSIFGIIRQVISLAEVTDNENNREDD